jgi:crotonobetainyl-CoA:carnitine CoA-transferase CaiB-like acyl-CoA transferase
MESGDVLPLTGITVLDFSTLLPGPLATFMLAEAGARVIKIERPGGEDMRGFAPHVGDMSAPFAVLNGGKEFVALDLKNARDREKLDALLEKADIIVEQFRPGVMKRLGLDHETIAARFPRIIYCSISGYGEAGPRSLEAGHDLNYQAVAGLLSLSPGSLDAPTVPAGLVADIAGGSMPAVINILLALRKRDLTGRGCRLDIAMADAMFTFAWMALAQAHAGHGFPGSRDTMLTGASPRYQLYPTADGQLLAVGALEQKFWDAFCEAIDLPLHLREDHHSPQETMAQVRRIIGSQDAGFWRSLLEPRDCCCTIVRSLEEARNDPHFIARRLFAVEAIGEGGESIPAASIPIAPALRKAFDVPRPVKRPGAD